MAELSEYAARLTSMTAGEGSYTIEFSHYEAAPHHVQQRLAQQFRPTEEA
jgi:elongation factor G